MADLAKTTRLQAINSMLSAIGESPVNSLDSTATADVALAQHILDEVLRDLMTRQWSWNYLWNQTLQKDSDGYIAVPANWAAVDHDTYDYIEKGGYLYDQENETDVFTSDVTGLKATVMLDWDDMPQAARQYAVVRASRIFVNRHGGSPEAVGPYTAADERTAWNLLQEFEGEQADFNIFKNPDVMPGLRRSL